MKNMKDNLYFQMKEISSNEDFVESKNVNMSMGWFEKQIKNFLLPDLKAREKRLTDTLEDLKKTICNLTHRVNALSNDLSQLSNELEKNKGKVDIVFSDYNTRNASSDSKYRLAIDDICRLNEKIRYRTSMFRRGGYLENLQLLVKYLYEPSVELQTEILEITPDDDKSKNISDETKNILKEIDAFNVKFKPDLINFLSKLGFKWEDCVLFPEEFKYDSKKMCSYNEMEIEEEAQIYVVSLGYEFPNSNLGKQLPVVFKRTN